MGKPIFKLYMLKPKSSWFQLSKAKQETTMKSIQSQLAKVGARSIIACNCSWASEEWAFFGLEEFPDIEALQKHSELCAEFNWPFEFGESYTILGTKME